MYLIWRKIFNKYDKSSELKYNPTIRIEKVNILYINKREYNELTNNRDIILDSYKKNSKRSK